MNSSLIREKRQGTSLSWKRRQSSVHLARLDLALFLLFSAAGILLASSVLAQQSAPQSAAAPVYLPSTVCRSKAQQSPPRPAAAPVFRLPSTVYWSGASKGSLEKQEATPFWANRGHWNFGVQIAFALENDIPRNISHINLLYAQPQLGFIVQDFQSSRFPVRRFELLSEGILGNAIHPGGRVTGHSLLFRFDGKPYRRIVPFFDVGAGILNTTLNSRAPELSGHTQFNPQGGFGLQYFFNPQRAFVFEYRYMHMSNAGLEEPNHGFNASMVSVGFRWLRRPRPKLENRN